MSDRTAFILGATVSGLIALDLGLGWGGTLFVLRRLADLVDWLIFWH
jgi:hypothetical protein